MIGFEIPWTRSALCAIQAVAIEPPRFCAMSRLVNALFTHFRGSMALFFHPSRIIRARRRCSAGRDQGNAGRVDQPPNRPQGPGASGEIERGTRLAAPDIASQEATQGGVASGQAKLRALTVDVRTA